MALLSPSTSLSSSSSSSSSYLSNGLPSSLLISKPRNRNLKIFRNSSSSSAFTTKASWQELAGVLIFSAIPFTAVKAIANSSIGAALQSRLQEKKKVAVQNSAKFNALAEKAREESCVWMYDGKEEVVPDGGKNELKMKISDPAEACNPPWVRPASGPSYGFGRVTFNDSSFWYGEERPRWLGPIPYVYPEYLSGELPGDYGFDIAGLSKDPVAFEKYFNFEILHARWAMLAALGVLIPELLDQFGIVHFVEPVWWRVGYAKLKGDTLDYLGIPGLHIAGSQGVIVIAICQALLMVGPEYARYCGIEALEPLGIYLPGDINYPGGLLFDPLGLSKNPVEFEDLKVKEIKNGRLAMVAWIGFYVQAALTGKGPIQNLIEHLSDPFHNNLLSAVKSM